MEKYKNKSASSPFVQLAPYITSERFHKLGKQFIKLYLLPDYKQILQLTKPILVSEVVSVLISKFLHCVGKLYLKLFNQTINMLMKCLKLPGRKHHNWSVKMAYCYKEGY